MEFYVLNNYIYMSACFIMTYIHFSQFVPVYKMQIIPCIFLYSLIHRDAPNLFVHKVYLAKIWAVV